MRKSNKGLKNNPLLTGLQAWLPDKNVTAMDTFFGVSRIDPKQKEWTDFINKCKHVTKETK